VTGSDAAARRPVRDRPTWLAYLQLSAWAWFLYAFGATQALLRDEQGTSKSISSLHGSSFAVGGLIGGLLTASAIRLLGRGAVMRICALATSAAMLLYTAPNVAPPVTMLAAGLGCLFGTALLIAINAFLLDHQSDSGAAAITEANAFAAFATLLGPLVVGIGVSTVFGWRLGIWTAMIGMIALEIWRGRHISAYGTREQALHESQIGRMPKSIGWSLALIAFFIATEFSMTLWGADLLREQCKFGPAAAAASLASISGGIFLGRLIRARLALKVPPEIILRGSVCAALAAFAVMWSFTLWPIVVLGMCAVGIGLGVQWPMGVARAVRASDGLTDRAAAYCSISASIAIIIAPVLLGILADHVGLHTAFLIVPCFMVLALALLLVRPEVGEHHVRS